MAELSLDRVRGALEYSYGLLFLGQSVGEEQDAQFGHFIEDEESPGPPDATTQTLLTEEIDKALAIARRPEVVFASFGDMIRVPGSKEDLLNVKASGGDVRVVYSPLDAVKIAAAHTDRQVVFFAVGFETTAPANAMAVLRARDLGIDNFSILSSHVLVPPAMEAILGAPFEELFAPPARERIQGYLKSVDRERNCVVEDSPLSLKDKTVTFRIFAIRDDEHESLIVILNDITDQNLAEDALQVSKERYLALVENSSDAILMLDSRRVIVSCNRAFLEMFGYERKETQK